MKKNKKLQKSIRKILERVRNDLDVLDNIYLLCGNLYYTNKFEEQMFFETLGYIANDINEIYVRYRHSEEKE